MRVPVDDFPRTNHQAAYFARWLKPGLPCWVAGYDVEIGMDRAQKSAAVAELNRTFTESGVVVVTRNLGLTVAQSTALRVKMRDAGASYKVAKNRLARIAAEGTAYTSLSDLLTGPTALSTSADPVAAAKAVVDFAKTNDKLEIVGGAMGDTVLDVNGVKALAELPSLDALRAKIVGLIQAPATKVVQIVQAPAGQLARVFAAYADKDAA
jgi:large subunit ribosomal protein L10